MKRKVRKKNLWWMTEKVGKSDEVDSKSKKENTRRKNEKEKEKEKGKR